MEAFESKMAASLSYVIKRGLYDLIIGGFRLSPQNKLPPLFNWQTSQNDGLGVQYWNRLTVKLRQMSWEESQAVLFELSVKQKMVPLTDGITIWADQAGQKFMLYK